MLTNLTTGPRLVLCLLEPTTLTMTYDSKQQLNLFASLLCVFHATYGYSFSGSISTLCFVSIALHFKCVCTISLGKYLAELNL